MPLEWSRRGRCTVTSDDCALIVYASASGGCAARHVESREGAVRRPHVTMCYGIGIVKRPCDFSSRIDPANPCAVGCPGSIDSRKSAVRRSQIPVLDVGIPKVPGYRPACNDPHGSGFTVGVCTRRVERAEGTVRRAQKTCAALALIAGVVLPNDRICGIDTHGKSARVSK